MENQEKMFSQTPETKFWSDLLKKSGIYKQLSYFNNVTVGKVEPNPELGFNLVLSNIILDNKHYNIYHTDQDTIGASQKIKEHNGHEIYIQEID